MPERSQIHGLPQDYGTIENQLAVTKKIDYATRLQEIYDYNNYLDLVSKEIKKGAYPIFYSNHNHHANIAGMQMVIDALEYRPKDIYVVLAYTLLNIGQDEKLVNFAKGLIPALEKDAIHPVPVTRPKDAFTLKKMIGDKYGRDAGRQAARDAMEVSDNNYQFLKETLCEDAGMVVFPPSTTEEAMKEDGKRKGMQRVESPFLTGIYQEARKVGRDILWVPIGMRDTNRIAEPRSTRTHMRANFEVAKEIVGMQLGIDLGAINPIATVKIGEPFYIESDEIYGNSLNDFAMSEVARLLPQNARGEYEIPGQNAHELCVNKPHRLGSK